MHSALIRQRVWNVPAFLKSFVSRTHPSYSNQSYWAKHRDCVAISPTHSCFHPNGNCTSSECASFLIFLSYSCKKKFHDDWWIMQSWSWALLSLCILCFTCVGCQSCLMQRPCCNNACDVTEAFIYNAWAKTKSSPITLKAFSVQSVVLTRMTKHKHSSNVTPHPHTPIPFNNCFTLLNAVNLQLSASPNRLDGQLSSPKILQNEQLMLEKKDSWMRSVKKKQIVILTQTVTLLFNCFC
jgi:hypothetical protein